MTEWLPVRKTDSPIRDPAQKVLDVAYEGLIGRPQLLIVKLIAMSGDKCEKTALSTIIRQHVDHCARVHRNGKPQIADLDAGFSEAPAGDLAD